MTELVYGHLYMIYFRDHFTTSRKHKQYKLIAIGQYIEESKYYVYLRSLWETTNEHPYQQSMHGILKSTIIAVDELIRPQVL